MMANLYLILEKHRKHENFFSQFRKASNKWFNYAKGGVGESFLCSVFHVVNWRNNGHELKEFLCSQYPYLKGKVEWCTHNTELYFEPGITWASISPTGFRPRLLEAGAISSNASFTVFPRAEDIHDLFGVLLSEPARYLMRILCPTINQTMGGVSLLPIPADRLKCKEYTETVKELCSSVRAKLSAQETTTQPSHRNWRKKWLEA